MKRLNLNINARIHANARKLTVLPQHTRIGTVKKYREVDIAIALCAAFGIGTKQNNMIYVRKGCDGTANIPHLYGMRTKYPFEITAGFDHVRSLFRRAICRA